jgi:hypothetical protein
MFTRYRTFGAAVALALCLPWATSAVAAPAYVWGQSYGTSGSSSRGFGVATDAAGNVIITGSFIGSVSFGGPALVAQGTDVVVAKYNSGGTHLWSKRFGGTLADQGYGVAVDGAGNIAITGYFQGTAAYFGGTNLVSVGNSDIFVAKYDANGTHIFSKATGTPDLDVGYSIASDNSGNCYATGYLHGIVPSDAIIVKYGPTGTYLWGKVMGTVDGYDEGLSITMDPTGNPVVTGSFSGSVDFGGGPLATSSIDDLGYFRREVRPSGGHIWSRRYGSTNLDEGLAVKTDAAGNVLVSGYFPGIGRLRRRCAGEPR